MCEKFEQNHQLSFLAKVIFEYKFGWHEQHGFKAYTKKEVENEVVLHVVRYLKCFYKVVINNVNEMQLYEAKNNLKYLKDANKALMKILDEVMTELHKLKAKTEERESEESEK